MAISAKEVNKLRQETGAGMMDCKKALTEAEGDFQKAIEILRKKGEKISAKRADMNASEGIVFAKISDDKKVAYAVAINCETDFVAKNEEFVNVGNDIVAVVAQNQIGTIDDVKAATLPSGELIGDKLTDLMGKIGEKIELTAIEKVEGDQVVSYIHSNGKLGVLVALTGANGDAVEEIGKDVAMQVAAMNPVALGPDQVSEEIKVKELEIGREQALAEGKPEQIVDKIAQGKLQKYYKDNTLLEQPFVKDNGKSVKQVLKDVDSNLTVSEFKRISVA